MWLRGLMLVVCVFCFAPKAEASSGPSYNPGDIVIFAGMRISYQKDLGFGVGIHGSYWKMAARFPIEITALNLPYSITAGAGLYQQGARAYAGLQTGLIGGAGIGVFGQKDRTGFHSGKYYDVWAAFIGGVSVRQFMKWGDYFRDTPLDSSLLLILPMSQTTTRTSDGAPRTTTWW